MAETVISSAYRQRLAACMAGGAPLRPVAFMAFGDGGHNADNTPKPPNQDATALYHEVVRKALTVSQDDAYSLTGNATLSGTDMVGLGVSEAALLDSAGQIIGMKTFAPKFKEADEVYPVSIKLRF